MTNHTDTSRSGDLVERLRYSYGDQTYILRDIAADRIEALEAENERWKELLHRSADQICSLTGDFGSEDNDLADEIRAALGEKQ